LASKEYIRGEDEDASNREKKPLNPVGSTTQDGKKRCREKKKRSLIMEGETFFLSKRAGLRESRGGEQEA